jgi:hypothetical protein
MTSQSKPELSGQMMGLSEATALIRSGGYYSIAGDEGLLRELPRGHWIGGTIPYFMGPGRGHHDPQPALRIADTGQQRCAVDALLRSDQPGTRMRRCARERLFDHRHSGILGRAFAVRAQRAGLRRHVSETADRLDLGHPPR